MSAVALAKAELPYAVARGAPECPAPLRRTRRWRACQPDSRLRL